MSALLLAMALGAASPGAPRAPELHLVPALRCELCEELDRQEREASFDALKREVEQMLMEMRVRRLLEGDTPREALARQRARHLPPGWPRWNP